MGKLEVILLDTHVVAWLAREPQKLSRGAARAIRQASNNAAGIAISCITLFELAHLVQRGRIRTVLPLDDYLQHIESRFVVLPLTGAVAARSVQLPVSYPNDPMDRIIGATALVESLPLVTADTEIQNSNAVKTIW